MDDNATRPASGHGEHEKSDINVRAVTRFGVGLGISAIASLALMGFVFTFFVRKEAASSPPAPQMHKLDPMKEPPEPRLQTRPAPDLKAIRADEDALLNRYNWIDAQKGLVRIPVSRAMELVAKEGLPHREGKP